MRFNGVDMVPTTMLVKDRDTSAEYTTFCSCMQKGRNPFGIRSSPHSIRNMSPLHIGMSNRRPERRFTTTPLTGPGGAEKGNPVYEWNGHTRAWRYSKETMGRLDQEGRLYYSRTGYPRQKLYLDESHGVPAQDVWDDIRSLSGSHKERLGYPTQKPQALLERIIQAVFQRGRRGSRPVLRVRHGGGGRREAEAPLDRHRHHAPCRGAHEEPAQDRLRHRSRKGLPGRRRAGGRRQRPRPGRAGPATSSSSGPMSLLEAFPRESQRRGADRGVDGLVYFIDGPRRAMKKAVVQVKSGKVSSPLIRDLEGTVEREKAALGLFITLEEPTSAMRTEAVGAGFYHSDVWQRDYPEDTDTHDRGAAGRQDVRASTASIDCTRPPSASNAPMANNPPSTTRFDCPGASPPMAGRARAKHRLLARDRVQPLQKGLDGIHAVGGVVGRLQ